MSRPETRKVTHSTRDTARRVLQIESEAVAALAGRLDTQFDQAVDWLVGCQGRVVVTGMGKSGIICHKVATTLASTGTPAFFMHPAEALHGDLGMIVSGDVLLTISNSGETQEVIRLLELVRRLGTRIIALTGNPESTLARFADAHLDVGVRSEACSMDLVPTASTCAALAMGDALAVCCYETRGFTAQDYARYHPGGRLGRKLLQVEALMHRDSAVPRVARDAPMDQVVRTMSEGRLGMTCVVDGEVLVGIVTDGDLRRRMMSMPRPLEGTAEQAMTGEPVTIGAGALASEALQLLEERKITSLAVVDDDRRLVGVIQIHDLWKTELF